MMEIFGWVEQTPVSLWVRESYWAFPGMLTFHAIGMGVLAGGGLLVGLRRAGFARVAPLAAFGGFNKVLWAGFWTSLVSGLFLLSAYPAKALTNPVFGLKFILLGAGFWLLRAAMRRPEQEEGLLTSGRALAGLSMASLVGAIFAGRFLAYTHHILLAY